MFRTIGVGGVTGCATRSSGNLLGRLTTPTIAAKLNVAVLPLCGPDGHDGQGPRESER
jgi:hypothetical protein